MVTVLVSVNGEPELIEHGFTRTPLRGTSAGQVLGPVNSVLPVVKACGFHQDADFAVDGLRAISSPNPSRRPPIIELMDYEYRVIAQPHNMILTAQSRPSMKDQ
jgi:hypothetical protein